MPNAELDTRGLYTALDAHRQAKELSWRQAAHEVGISASTFTRLGQGRRPDVDSFAALLAWLGQPAESFFTGAPETNDDHEPLAKISTLLRASKRLGPESLDAMNEIIRAAYNQLREK